MRITVTQEHINQGQRRVCSRCPLAIAITEAAGVPMNVGIYGTWPESDPERYTQLPNAAWAFIEAFDEREPVQPFTFELELSR